MQKKPDGGAIGGAGIDLATGDGQWGDGAGLGIAIFIGVANGDGACGARGGVDQIQVGQARGLAGGEVAQRTRDIRRRGLGARAGSSLRR